MKDCPRVLDQEFAISQTSSSRRKSGSTSAVDTGLRRYDRKKLQQLHPMNFAIRTLFPKSLSSSQRSLGSMTGVGIGLLFGGQHVWRMRRAEASEEHLFFRFCTSKGRRLDVTKASNFERQRS
jgi:hypothetical protein